MTKPRGILVAGNWKMNHGPRETEVFFSTLTSLKKEKAAETLPKGLDCALFVPFISLHAAKTSATAVGGLGISIGAQNAHWEKKGAFTGEISGPMLQELGVEWVLMGHSERRQFFGETDGSVFMRTESLLKQGFHGVTCIGETREQREKGLTNEVLSKQISDGLGQLDPALVSSGRLTLAYEPVWAIGTGLNAAPEQAQDAHQFIRDRLGHHFGSALAQKVRILYGGSVTPENVGSYLDCKDVDGVLVGGASLKPEGFLKIIHSATSKLGG